MALPWVAMGIGALMGGMSAKQRGGDFMKGALTGAALGGVTGGLGGKFGGFGAAGTKAGGIFGLGTGMMPNFLALSGIGMGTEMMGQQEANKAALEGRRRLFDEEEEERLRRLSEIAGYDVADSQNFLTPQSYFSADGGIVNTRKGFYNGGGAWADIPMEESGPTMDPEIMQLPMGQEGSFESENEDFLELSGLTDEEMSELQALQSLSIVTPEGDPNYEKIQIRLQELMGRLKVARGGHINRPGYDRGGNIHPGTEDEGFTYDFDIDGDKYDFSFAERFTDDPEKKKKIMEMIMLQARLKQPTGRLLQDTIDTTADNELMSGLGSGDEDYYNSYIKFMEDRAIEKGRALDAVYEGNMGDASLTKSQRGDIMEMIASRTNPMAFRAQGGQVNRPGYFLGGLASLLGGAGLLSKIFGGRKKSGEALPMKKPILEKIPGPGRPWMPGDDEDEMPVIGLPWERPIGIEPFLPQLLNRAQGGSIERPGYKFGGGIDWSKVQAAMTNTGGFDSSGGETWQQAKSTQMNDPGLWTNKFFDQRTPMAKDYNRLLKNRNKFGEGYIDRAGIGLNTEEKFFNEYPNIPQTFDPFKDLEEQMRIGEFPKKAPEGYFEQYNLAQGGIADLDMRGGGASFGPGTGTSDDVPAMLSDGEFVMTADAVSNLGGGDRMVGAKRMYNMMNQLDPNSQSPGEMNVAGYG